MHRPVWLLSLAFAAALAAGAAAAATDITVGIHQTVRVALPGTAANVVIADPTVADVAVTDSHSLIIIGKGYGVSGVMVTDHAGRVLMNSRVAVVGSDGGLVTVYRGAATDEYNCSSRCQILASGAAPPVAQAPAPAQAQAQAPGGNGMVTMTIAAPASALGSHGM
jgi:hypothetical protein